MGKRRNVLPNQKLTRQKSKLLMRSGGELEDMMLGSVVEKMRKGGNAERIVKAKKGKDKKQKYKLGGWTHSD
tara:strand:- start:3229 stop:3444 length:216 start_codon:yes stop_codon:yes gene_type:complete